jgi:UDP:flavonoid glycosyltransferase YjiC (YdhE family)
MRDLVNDFRVQTLGLPRLHTRQATYMLIEEKVPYTYCWSPSIVPKPEDWAEHINVSGFFFLKHDATAPSEQSEDLIKFLGLNHKHHHKSFAAPIYIGFGSITGHDSKRILGVVLEALEKTGYRAILSGLTNDEDKLPEKIFKLDKISHDWLFPHG